MADDSQTLWYFAYGSNMQRATFYGRRRMQPLEWRRARLDDHRLCFNLPIGPGERGVANIEPAPGAVIHGVAFHLAVGQLESLDRTEGVALGFYERSPVRVWTEEGAPLDAHTYRSHYTRDGRKPSARYIGLLLEGAREHALPPDYIRLLESFALAVDERDPP